MSKDYSADNTKLRIKRLLEKSRDFKFCLFISCGNHTKYQYTKFANNKGLEVHRLKSILPWYLKPLTLISVSCGTVINISGKSDLETEILDFAKWGVISLVLFNEKSTYNKILESIDKSFINAAEVYKSKILEETDSLILDICAIDEGEEAMEFRLWFEGADNITSEIDNIL